VIGISRKGQSLTCDGEIDSVFDRDTGKYVNSIDYNENINVRL